MLGFGLGLNKWRRVGGGFVGLLDLFPNAAAAYSLRLLRKDYSGGLVRARAWDGSANQGEADVMAYRVSATEYVLDLNSTLENLDATAISRGLTTSDTLADLVSTGVNDYDGLTSAWYDQSLSNDATQSTAANQPKIVSGGSLVTENGKAAIDFDGVNDVLQSAFTSSQPLTIATVGNIDTARTFDYFVSLNSTFVLGSDGTPEWRLLAGSSLTNGAVSSNQTLLFSVANSTSSILSVNGNSVSGDAGTDTANLISIGARTIGGGELLGSVSELIIWSLDQSASRTGIETNINTFYSIYP